MDELCVRLSPSLWLWIAASRLTHQVLGFAFGQRDQDTLALCWSDVPQDYPDKPVVTDGLETYACFFPEAQHRAVLKGSGETSIVESLNTLWRQRQSGLARRSCGVSRRIETDLVERFFLLVEQHNSRSQARWERHQQTTLSGQ